jgi:hypothetical protein
LPGARRARWGQQATGCVPWYRRLQTQWSRLRAPHERREPECRDRDTCLAPPPRRRCSRSTHYAAGLAARAA